MRLQITILRRSAALAVLAALVALLHAGARTAARPAVIGAVGGTAQSIALNGDWLYLGMGLQLLPVNIADRDHPVPAQSALRLPELARDLATVGDTAYVALADGYTTLALDLTDPSRPTIAGSAQTRARMGISIAADGGLLAVSGMWASSEIERRLDLFDISAPLRPSRVVSVPDNDQATDLALTKGHLYLGSEMGVPVYDLADPAKPQRMGEVPVSGGSLRLAAGGDRLNAVGNQGLSVLDLSTPGSPAVVGHLATDKPAYQVTADGDQVLVGLSDGRVQLVDTSQPATPRLLDTTQLGGVAGPAALTDNRGYVAAYNRGLDVVSYRNGVPPEVSNVPLTFGGGAYVAVTDQAAYVATSPLGLAVVDRTVPGSPRLLGQTPITSTVGATTPLDVEVADGEAYTLGSPDELCTVDVRVPERPRLSGCLSVAGAQANDLVALGGGRMAAAGRNGLFVVEPGRSDHPIIGTLTDVALSHAVGAGNTLYGVDALTGRRLQVVDLTVPSRPHLVTTLDVPGVAIRALALLDDRVYAGGTRGTAALVQSGVGPSQPQPTRPPEPPTGAVAVVDITQRLKPRIADTWDVPTAPDAMTASEAGLTMLHSYTAAGTYDNALTVRYTDGTLVTDTVLPMGMCWDVAGEGNLVYVTSLVGGLFEVSLTGAAPIATPTFTTTAEAPPTVTATPPPPPVFLPDVRSKWAEGLVDAVDDGLCARR
jgi:hypothetical protein